MRKKGEITSSQIVMILILLASFATILYVISQLFLSSDTIDREACHASVLARDLANTNVYEGSDILPLNCQTEKICIGPNKCEDNFFDTNNLGITKVKLNSDNREEIQSEVLNVYSDALLNCNTMLGEGFLNFFPSKLTSTNYCVVCSRIALDDSLISNSPNNIKYLDLYKTMEEKRYGDKNFLESLYGVKTTEQISADYQKVVDQIESGSIDYDGDISKLKKDLEGGFVDWTFDPRKEHAVLVKISKSGDLVSKVGGTLAISGSVLTLTGIGGFIGIPLTSLASAFGGGVTYLISLDSEKGYYYHAPYIIEYDKDDLLNLGCDSFENLP